MAQRKDPTLDKLRMSARFSTDNDTTVITGDSEKVMKSLPTRSVQLILTSPPYNIGKEYELRKTLDEYIATQRAILAESVRILKHGGSLCWQVGSSFDAKTGRLIMLDRLIDELMDEHCKNDEMVLRNRIVWHYEHGFHCSHRFSGRYETVLWYTKGAKYKFNLDHVRVPQKYPGKRSFKGAAAGNLSGNPLGKNPGDFWTCNGNDVWKIPNVKSKHVEKMNHPCQFPMELAGRLILALTEKADIVLDPFGGVGTTAATAMMLSRRSISIDKMPEYSATARQRLKMAWNRTLPFRPTRDVHVPSVGDAVAKMPEEFRKARTEAQQALDLAIR